MRDFLGLAEGEIEMPCAVRRAPCAVRRTPYAVRRTPT